MSRKWWTVLTDAASIVGANAERWLAKSGKVGVAQFVLRNLESLYVLKAHSKALTLNTLRFASEIRPADPLRLPVNEKLVMNEVNLSLKLIGHDGRIRTCHISRHLHRGREKADRRQGEGTQTKPRRPSLSAATLSIWLPPCREPGAEEAEENTALFDVDQIHRH